MTTPTHTDIPLSELRLSPSNARQDPGDVSGLANSIRHLGLISALAVTRNGTGWLVEAGGRRLAALHQLRDQGHITKHEPIPCMVFDTPSLARSLAENTERDPMDAVQQFQAFDRLIGEGRTVHEVAEAFSVTPQFVRQRVKLAELAPEVIAAYRQGRCTLDQMAALTFGSHAQQRAIVASGEPVPGPWQLRERLRGKVIPRDDKRVKFVGVEAYIAAGGSTIDDLFASTADLVDADLLDRLVAQKLQAIADEQVAGGKAFAQVVEQDKFWQNKGFEAVQLEYLPTDEQAAQIEQIESDIAELEEGLPEEFTEANRGIRAQIRDLALQQQRIKDAASRPNTDAPIGVLITLGYHGRPDFREVIRAEDAKALYKAKVERAAANGTAPPPTTHEPAGRADLTKNGAIEIAQARQAGLALLLATNTQLALALIVQAWDYAIFGGIQPNVTGSSWARPAPFVSDIRACPTDRPSALSERLRAITTYPAADRRAPYRTERTPRAHLPLSWYIEQPKTALLEILAHCVAHALCDPDSSDGTGQLTVPTTARDTIADLVDATTFDLADYWEPSPEWLKGHGKAKTLQALASIGLGELYLDEFKTLKAGEVYTKAAPLLAEKRWVPEYGTAGALRGGA